MIAFLEGQIVEKSVDSMLLLTNGVGYQLFYDPAMISRFPAVGETVRVYTYLYVREDNLKLFALPSPDDRHLFELLLSVSGVGPKLAQAVTAQLSSDQFALSVLNGDVKTLTGVKGLGKKGAERIILELKDKLKKESAGLSTDSMSPDSFTNSAPDRMAEEAVAALVVLGYSQKDARAAVQRCLLQNQNLDSPMETAEIIRRALRLLSVL